jgi:hypothetical protein
VATRRRYVATSLWGLGTGGFARGPVELSYVHAAAGTMVGVRAVRAVAAEGAVAQGWDVACCVLRVADSGGLDKLHRVTSRSD